ncbi:hypothetical protein KM043_007811 [Ampulex compressa]|nr:hypothetical protein KM043_007811 [Ampulex compressa]
MEDSLERGGRLGAPTMTQRLFGERGENFERLGAMLGVKVVNSAECHEKYDISCISTLCWRLRDEKRKKCPVLFPQRDAGKLKGRGSPLREAIEKDRRQREVEARPRKREMKKARKQAHPELPRSTLRQGAEEKSLLNNAAR